MREHTRRCVVALPADVLWDFLSDYANVIRCASSQCSALLESGAPGVTGAKYSASAEWEGIRSLYRVELAEAQRPATLTWRAASPGAAGSVRFDLEDAGDGTTVLSATARLSLGKAILPLEPFGWGLMDRMFERFMRHARGLGIETGAA